MRYTTIRWAAAALALALGSGLAMADDSRRVRAKLSGYQEVPAVNTAASGRFEAKLANGMIAYELSYRGIASNVLQAHIHFGQKGVNGGVSVFLCSNLGNGPAGTPACPLGEGTVSGTLGDAAVVGPNGQGIAPGLMEALQRAIRAGVAYANVHSSTFPGGEIRGQIADDD